MGTLCQFRSARTTRLAHAQLSLEDASAASSNGRTRPAGFTCQGPQKPMLRAPGDLAVSGRSAASHRVSGASPSSSSTWRRRPRSPWRGAVTVNIVGTPYIPHMARERAVQETQRSQRALLRYELLFSPEHPGQHRAAQAALLGLDVDQKFTAVAVRFDRWPAQEQDPDRWPRHLYATVARCEVAMNRLAVTSHRAMAEDDGVLLVLPPTARPLDGVIAALIADIEAHQRSHHLAVRVSPPSMG